MSVESKTAVFREKGFGSAVISKYDFCASFFNKELKKSKQEVTKTYEANPKVYNEFCKLISVNFKDFAVLWDRANLDIDFDVHFEEAMENLGREIHVLNQTPPHKRPELQDRIIKKRKELFTKLFEKGNAFRECFEKYCADK